MGGSVSSCTPSCKYVIRALSGFNDTSSPVEHWLNIELVMHYGGSMEVLEEYTCGTNYGFYCEAHLCSASTDTTYTNEITWDGVDGGWFWSTSACSYTGFVSTRASETIARSGSVDFMESNDSPSADFSSTKAYSSFHSTLYYEDSYEYWHDATYSYPYNVGAVSSVGASYTCSTDNLWVNSNYAGPWSYSNTPPSACT